MFFFYLKKTRLTSRYGLDKDSESLSLHKVLVIGIFKKKKLNHFFGKNGFKLNFSVIKTVLV